MNTKLVLVLAIASTPALSQNDEVAALRLHPAMPVAGEAVYADYFLVQGCGNHLDLNKIQVTMHANRINAELRLREDALATGCSPGLRQFIELGRFPAGEYTVEVGYSTYPSPPFEIDAADTKRSIDFTVSPRAEGNRSINDVSGFWSSQEDPGWSLGIYQQPNGSLIVSWVTFGSNGEQQWYFLLPGTWTSTNVYEASIARAVDGPYFGRTPPIGQSLRPLPPHIDVVVSAKLSFGKNAPASAAMSFLYSVNGVEASRRLMKLQY
jgi:hypothetical protein